MDRSQLDIEVFDTRILPLIKSRVNDYEFGISIDELPESMSPLIHESLFVQHWIKHAVVVGNRPNIGRLPDCPPICNSFRLMDASSYEDYYVDTMEAEHLLNQRILLLGVHGDQFGYHLETGEISQFDGPGWAGDAKTERCKAWGDLLAFAAFMESDWVFK